MIGLNLIQNLGSRTEEIIFIGYRHPPTTKRTDLKRLRFVCMLDTHNKIEKISIPDGDIFEHCGGAVKYRTSARDLRNFNQYVGQLSHKYKLFASCNHCVCLNPKRPEQSQK